jgi:hypothetical protein
MGHLINPFSLRLGLNRQWGLGLVSQRQPLAYNGIKEYIESFFDSREFRDAGFIYSNVLIQQTGRNIRVEVFVYDGVLDRLARARVKFSQKPGHTAEFSGFRALSDLPYSYSFSLWRPTNPAVLSSGQGAFSFFSFLYRSKFYRVLESILEKEILSLFFSGMKVESVVKIRAFSAQYLSASILSRYITRKLEYQYNLQEVVLPLMKGLEKRVVGFVAKCSGRFTRVQRASQNVYQVGLAPRSTLSMRFDYGFRATRLKYGVCGVKVILCRKR